jgi:23S rRNA (guanosine2251-2'-O)-methyltransferase
MKSPTSRGPGGRPGGGSGGGKPGGKPGGRPGGGKPGGPYRGNGAAPGPRGDAPRGDSPTRAAPLTARPGGPGGGHGPRPHPEGPRRDQTRPDQPRQDAPDRTLRRPPPAEHRPPPRGPSIETPRGAVWLYGPHAVAAALTNPARRLRRLVLTEEAEAALAARLPQPWSVAPERMERPRLDQLLGRDVVHQGIALLADPLAPPVLAAVLERPGPFVVLDQVSDPRNVGAALRSAAAFGAAAVVTQDRNAPEETGALAKAASGALETVPLLRAVNIARTLIALKAAGLWCVGLDAAGGTPLSGPGLAERRVALVLGAEGEGMRRLTRETCDEVCRLDMPGAMESLNVSAACAIALYELCRPKGGA